MADIVVQPKVKNAQGTYDNLIMFQGTYASSDTSKGTIEERLTRLAHKETTITNSSGNILVKLYRQGNYVFGIYNGYYGGIQHYIQELNGLVIPDNFRPKEDTLIVQTGTYSIQNPFGSGTLTYQTTARIFQSGQIEVLDYLNSTTLGYYNPVQQVCFGYEAPPITN